MAVKGDETRARLVEAARALVEAKGYHGTGLNEVLAVSGAPRGSLYHHFPGGKDELIGAALTAAGREVEDAVRALAATERTPADLVRALLDVLAGRMTGGDYAKGCPVATVALEVAGSGGALQEACAAVYARWERALADVLRAAGHPAGAADDLAATVLALVEGALVLARAARSRDPVDRVGRRVTALLGD